MTNFLKKYIYESKAARVKNTLRLEYGEHLNEGSPSSNSNV